MINQSFLVALVLLAGGCRATTMVDRLTHGDLKPKHAFCAMVKPMGGPSLAEALAVLPKSTISADKTGVYVLEDGGGAMVSRAWLSMKAVHSIDIQYFIFSADNVGLIATDLLLKAAERGVQVRIIVDDVLVDTDATFLRALDAHPNLHIKIYNPALKAGKNLPTALFNLVTDFRGANQRMHNKTLIVDGQAVITGGRNVADEYFDFNTEYNFRDRDVLLLGAAVRQVQSSFEQFWGNKRSVPIADLLKPSTKTLNDKLWHSLHQYACDPHHFWPQVMARIANVPAAFAAATKAGKLRWIDEVAFVSDDPGKNKVKKGFKGRGLTTNTLIDLVRHAQKNVIIQTPYLVTTELSQKLFAETVARGVPVTILTNSMASTDGAEAFRGYQKDRAKLLAAGVKLYEFKPDAAIGKTLMNSALMKTMERLPTFGLHAKTMVVDDELLVVGTFNLDPRSAHLNTECITLIPDAVLARGVLDILKQEMRPENSWETTKEFNPDHLAPWALRFKVWMSSPIPKSIL